MAYDEHLADRIRKIVKDRDNLTEKRMFGGLAFLLHGNMCCGIIGDELMVRVGPDAYAAALAHPQAREMDFTGRSLKGYVYVNQDGLADEPDLREWVNKGVAFASTLPPKMKKGE